MLVTVVTCVNGRVLWVRILRGGLRTWVWQCMRDNHQLMAPQSPAEVTQFIADMTAHSQALAGAVQSFNQATL